MKKFIFSLEKVFRFKSQQLDIAMNELSLLRYELLEVENRLMATRIELEKKHISYQEQAATGMTVLEIKEYQYFKETLTQQIEAIEQERDALKERIDKQLLVVLEFKKDVSGLEKLKEKQLEEYNEEVRKQETEFILELVSAKTVVT